MIDSWPFIVLAASVVFIVVSITRYKLHPFLALVLAALVAGALARVFPETTVVNGAAVISSLGDVVRLTMEGFGRTAAGIAISIGLASIIGFCLMESGAADRVVRRFLTIFGERNAGIALLVSTYVLSIPIFFDTMFMLMAPLAKALHVRTGKNYLLYVLCVCCGGVITHSLTVPHPGPIAMVDNLKIDVGLSIIGGIVAGIIPAAVGYGVACSLDHRMNVPMRETPGVSLADLEAAINQKEEDLPSLTTSLAPVILPILLISISSFLKVADGSGAAWVTQISGLREAIDFIGDKNIALFIGAFLSIRLLAKQKHFNRAKIAALLGPPLETAGIIILITSAIMFPMIGPDLPYHPLYLFLSIGFGGFAASWMNDSGFWVVSRLSGLTEKETLKSWSVMLTIVSLAGLIVTWLGSIVLPLV